MSSLQLLKLSGNRYINVQMIDKIKYSERCEYHADGYASDRIYRQYTIKLRSGKKIDVSETDQEDLYKWISDLIEKSTPYQ